LLKVLIPKCCQNEQRYILDIMLSEFLGLDFEVAEYDGLDIKIGRPDDVACLSLNAVFFLNAEHSWLKYESMPDLPLKNWTPLEDHVQEALIQPDIPVLYGQSGLVKNDNNWHLNLDIFGSAFFMLSRYEELITADRDNHDRFPAIASVAYKENFLDRPIVNEYLEILWSCLNQLWPELERKNNICQMFVSCDVDQPYDCTVESFSKLVRTCVGDVYKRRSPIEMLMRINRFVFNFFGIYKFDRNYTFDWYMNVCDKAGLKAAFYFIPTSHQSGNGCYELSDKKIINLMKEINSRGHEIGVHGSYQTYQDKEKLIEQKLLMVKALKKVGIKQKIKGNRQHYLRWDSFLTPEYLDSAGFEYDTSGSFADRPGFRYGTANEFSMWGWQSQLKLNLKQRPLIVMECSVISDTYLGLGYGVEADRLMGKLKKNSMRYGGNFSLLWHNSHFINQQDKILFEKIVSE
jgi:hypothetical protein